MFVEVVLSNLSHLLLLRLFAGDEAIVRPRMQCPRPLDEILSGILENTKRETRARPRARFRSSLSLSLSLSLFHSFSLTISLILSFSLAFCRRFVVDITWILGDPDDITRILGDPDSSDPVRTHPLVSRPNEQPKGSENLVAAQKFVIEIQIYGFAGDFVSTFLMPCASPSRDEFRCSDRCVLAER